jgi:hypothetical protein
MKRVSTTALLVFFGATATIGLANAQNQPRSGGEVEVRTSREAALSGADQLREATAIIETMNAQRRQVSDLLDRARQERDIIKVYCLDDKLTQIDVTLRSAREHQELLQTAVSINNDGMRHHEFQLMTIFRQRSSGLEAEARQCLGEDTGTFDRDSRNILLVDPNIAEQDTTTLTPDMLTPDRPLVSSPVM